jgi:hypothetical protein
MAAVARYISSAPPVSRCCWCRRDVSQESIYKPQVKPDGTTVQFTYTMLMLFFQSVTGVLFALGTHTIIRTFNPSYGARMVNGVATKESELSLHLISRPGFSLCAAYYLLAMAFSNEALRFVSYPFQCAWLHASLGMCGAACMFACVCVCVCTYVCVRVCVHVSCVARHVGTAVDDV